MTTYTHDRPTFRERVMALAGHSTWREPAGGHSTAVRQIPSDHLVAAALSFGRRGQDDIGPDIAVDMATGRMGHKARVCEALGKAMAADRARLVQRNRPVIGVIAWAAYCTVLGLPPVPRPLCVREDDWGDLVAAGALILERLAEDALALAGRRARAA